MAVGGITRIIRGTRNVSTSMHLDGAWAFGGIWPGRAAWDVNMRSGATDVSRSVFDLHMTIFWICVVIGVLVFGVMIYSMIAHRRSSVSNRPTFTKTPASRCSGRSSAADHGGHGDPGDAHADPHLRLQRIGRGCADHRLPVEVALQVSGRGRGVLQQPHHTARADQQPVAQGRALPVGSRRAAGDPGRCQGPLPDHRGGRDPLTVGTGSGGEEGRHSRFHQ